MMMMQCKFEVVNLKTKKSHGVYDTLDEAKGCVAYDHLTDWEIWAQGMTVVEYRDSGRY